ncbi:MAG: YjbH domain-containing protein, partial [Paracoccaceae bacterium]
MDADKTLFCKTRHAALYVGIVGLCAAHSGRADTPVPQTSLNLYGVPGLFDMPTAHPMADADVSFTLGAFAKTQRNTFHFQITPRLSGAFRYSYIDNFVGIGDFYDRSFDFRYLIAEETMRRPAIAIGLQDFGGTGVYSGEYIVASKTFGRLRATGGLGWGRFGSLDGFDNPLSVLGGRFKTRPQQATGGQTGRLDADHWFRGNAALFGGLEYHITDRFSVAGEYSSDAYELETRRIGFDRKTPFNIGAQYRFKNGVDVSAGYLYGTTASLQLSYTLNPKRPTQLKGGLEPAPLPIAGRAPADIGKLGWTTQPGSSQILTDNLTQVMAGSGLLLQSLHVSASTAIVKFRNPTYPNPAQAIGRTARLMTSVLPASIHSFVLIPVTDNGLASTRIVLRRADLEDLEFKPDNAWDSFSRAQIEHTTQPDRNLDENTDLIPDFSWGIGTFVDVALFDPDAPLRADFGIELYARFEPTPGLVFTGLVKKRLTGNRDGARPSDSVLPHVRSDVAQYAQEGDLTLANLSGSYFFQPGEDLYGRVTMGYLEEMFAGVSGELLWKPLNANLALGLELNQVRQRDFDQAFGFQDYEVT